MFNQLGVLFYIKADYAQAETLKRRALAIDEKTYGPDHPEVAIRVGNLASLFEAIGRFAEAEPLHRRALAIHEASLGLDNPYVAIGLNNLARLLQATNRLAEAGTAGLPHARDQREKLRPGSSKGGDSP